MTVDDVVKEEAARLGLVVSRRSGSIYTLENTLGEPVSVSVVALEVLSDKDGLADVFRARLEKAIHATYR